MTIVNRFWDIFQGNIFQLIFSKAFGIKLGCIHSRCNIVLIYDFFIEFSINNAGNYEIFETIF
jgi:hypothetical protein